MLPKFRAWDREKNKMFEPTYRAYAGELEDLLISLKGDLILRKIDETIHESVFPDRFVLMQYTGLKDKNGVEIYEGDYVSLISFETKSEHKGEIVYARGSFCIEVEVEVKGCKYKVPFTSFEESNAILEVIGNIYENLELLKEQNK